MNSLVELSYKIAMWRESKGFHTDWDNMPEKLMLVVTECSEAMEEWRKNESLNVEFGIEIADAIIRLLDICGSLEIPIDALIKEKMCINEERPYKHGKRA